MRKPIKTIKKITRKKDSSGKRNIGNTESGVNNSATAKQIKPQKKISRRSVVKRNSRLINNTDNITVQQNHFFDNMIEAFTYPVYAIDAIKENIIISNSAAKECGIREGLLCSRIDYGSMKRGKDGQEIPLLKVKKTKKPVQFEYTLRDNNGNSVYREVYAYPIFDSGGKVIQMVEYIMDITERRRAQEELVKLSQAVEQSFNIVMITDKNSAIEYVNPKFTEITGYLLDEIAGKSVSFLGEMTGEEEKRFWDTLKFNGEWRGEFYNKKKNGEYYWEYASIYSIKNSQGIVTHYIKDAVNISKRKQAEEELRAAKEKAELANRFKSEFLADMSHEIRTPLNSILGFIELLLMTELNKTQKDYFDTIKDSSKVLMGIIDDILDFSKIESGKLDVDNIKFYLKHELEPVVDMFSARADEKNIELIYFIDPSLPEYIFGDPLRIKQVLNNLISNAVKFTHEHGRIMVDIKMTEQTDDVCRILFTVSDNGIGIPEDKKAMIFKAFFQADSAISRKYGGTGLGLAISSQLVRLMGGELRLESSPGIGSRFYFELPVTEFSGVDIFKRDYNFKNIKSYLFAKNEDEKLQLYNIERYLNAFHIETETFSSVGEISISRQEMNYIIFIHYSSNAKDEIKSILQSLPDVPVILIASRLDKDFIGLISDKITRVIYKPIYASKIIGVIIDLLYNTEQASSQEKPEEDFNMIPYSAEALVAEDNPINQKLITLMLKEIGINAVIVNNGLEVIESFKNKKYDIVLMDINMPIIDGIEATAKILELENAKGLTHTPIIALTAKTIRGDREIILNCGMDDYLSKPISIKKLYGTLYPFLKETQKENSSSTSEKHMKQEIDTKEYSIASTATELGVSAEFLMNLIEQFMNNFENNFDSLLKSIKNMNYDAICFEAHKLKGTASNLRFNNLAEVLSQVESNARGKNSINYSELLDTVNREFNSVKKNLSFLQ